MSIKNAFSILLISFVNAFFLYFWQSSIANSVYSDTVSVTQQKSTPPKFDPKDIDHQIARMESSSKRDVKLKSHPSTSPELEGDIHNEYQIRDDILASIEEMTKDNYKARKAAIKYAFYENQGYYHSLSSDEAVAWDKKSAVAGWCLVIFEPENWLFVKSKISEMLNNTSKRKQHIRDIDSNFFSGKILGSGLTEVEETEKCKSGVF